MPDWCTGLLMGYSRAHALLPANAVMARTEARKLGRRINISWQAVAGVFAIGRSPFASQLQLHLGRGKAVSFASGGAAACVGPVVVRDVRMLASLIVVFREVLEAGLIVGIVLAATQAVPQRGRWIVGGVAAGVLGALLLASFAGALSEAIGGNGQEVFNASVLLV